MIIYIIGMTKPFRTVDVNSPPRMTFAIGDWISLPGRSPPMASGSSAKADVIAVIRIGFSRSREPVITASIFEVPRLVSTLYLSISSIPLRVAMPNSEMNPMMAGMDRMPSVK